MDKPDLNTADDAQLVRELLRRGHTVSMADFERPDFDAFDGDRSYNAECAVDLARDLRFAYDELRGGRPASALAMLERVLFPKNPSLMAVKYDLARADRDPVTNRPRA
ncbi:MAG: hypothetical protein IH626_22985 [Rhodospirillales bacterium]|nr:hypothetical protein [Rhodospirillales bacterium]